MLTGSHDTLFLLCADTTLTFGGAFPCLPCNPNAAAVKSRS